MIQPPKLPRSHDDEPGVTVFWCYCPCGHAWVLPAPAHQCPQCGGTESIVSTSEQEPFKHY